MTKRIRRRRRRPVYYGPQVSGIHPARSEQGVILPQPLVGSVNCPHTHSYYITYITVQFCDCMSLRTATAFSL